MVTAAFDYLTLSLERGPAARQALAARIKSDVAAAGGEVVGLFWSQLGFASTEAPLLVRWPGGARGSLGAVTGGAEVMGFDQVALAPTIRPLPGQAPRDGGIYVHRWFVVDAGREDDFVALSGRAWGGFEGAYQTEIYGLFVAEPTAEDQALGQARLLLLTWYASHGVWEESREQTVDPEGLFVQRQQLTRWTIGRSSLRAAL